MKPLDFDSLLALMARSLGRSDRPGGGGKVDFVLKDPVMREATKAGLAHRLCVVRLERFGERGAGELARELEIPEQTWLNYEAGVTIPGELLLAFIECTGVEPPWLLRGSGARYRRRKSRPSSRIEASSGPARSDSSGES